MKIAIASHLRPDQLQSKTLALLKKHHFPFGHVYVFVSPVSMESYTPIAREWGFHLIESGSSILDARNHIIQFFKNGERVVEMDDDVEDIKTTRKGEKEKSVTNLQHVFEESFRLLGGKGLWGMNAKDNAFFGSGTDQWGLRSIINSCLGYVNDKSIRLTVSEKEDFERCILFYLKKCPILKRGGYGVKTKYWTNAGGIQEHYDKTKRIQVQAASAHALSSKYPELVREQERKGGIIDIRFRGNDPLHFYDTSSHVPSVPNTKKKKKTPKPAILRHTAKKKHNRTRM